MAMSMNAGGGGGKRRRGNRGGVMAEINMIPFIDVMLVLLIIFMVAAPMLTVGVPVDLPKTSAGELNIDKKPLAVTIDNAGRLFIQENETTLERLVGELTPLAKEGFDERIYVRGDKTADYGTVMQVMARISAAGYKNLGLVTLQEQDK